MDDPTTMTEDITFACCGVTLTGTLHLPIGSGPHPAIVMLAGSGPTDRESGGYFPPIRGAFLRAGLAVLSFDKPGIGASSGDWREQTIGDRAEQALAAVAWLRAYPAIDPGRVGLWGHSQGGWVVQLAAAQAGDAVASGGPADLAFAIVNSGPSISPERQDAYATEHQLRHAGVTEEDITLAVAYVERLAELAREGLTYEQLEAELLNDARRQSWYWIFPVDDPGLWEFLKRSYAYAYDPPSAIERIRCPILAIFGGRDLLLPGEESAAAHQRLLGQAGNHDVTIVVYPEGDHRLRTEDGTGFVPGYVDLLTEWTATRTQAATTGAGE